DRLGAGRRDQGARHHRHGADPGPASAWCRRTARPPGAAWCAASVAPGAPSRTGPSGPGDLAAAEAAARATASAAVAAAACTRWEATVDGSHQPAGTGGAAAPAATTNGSGPVRAGDPERGRPRDV